MNLVDSCGWLEYFADGANAGFFAPAVEDVHHGIVPSICLLEVFKKILQQKDEDSALQAVALMQQAGVVDLDSIVSIHAAKMGHELNIPLADSVILATARIYKAVIWTQDVHFKSIRGVMYKAKA
jgi:predicted nucleic acid-binding protein